MRKMLTPVVICMLFAVAASSFMTMWQHRAIQMNQELIRANVGKINWSNGQILENLELIKLNSKAIQKNTQLIRQYRVACECEKEDSND